MAALKVNETQTTTAGFITIDAGLAAGRYRFQLIVEDEDGNRSAPVETIVTVQPRRGVPT